MKYQRGIALVLVLWLAVLITLVVSSFALVARTEAVQSRVLFDRTQAQLLAMAGVHRAVYEQRRPNIDERWRTDGRPYRFVHEGAEVEVRITDESGKVDINAANPDMLAALLEAAGVETDAIDAMVDAILDWRDPDDLVSPNGAEDEDYEAAGYAYGARDGPFITPGELQQVMGVGYELYTALEPAITVYSGLGTPRPEFAPPEVLRALGMTPEEVQGFVDQREQTLDLDVPLPMLPDGTEPVTRVGSATFTVNSRATLANGTSAALEVTLRLGGGVGERPFRILNWKRI